VFTTQKHRRFHGPCLIFRVHHLSLSDALGEMLVAPALALLAIVFNFCALLHVTSNRNGHSTSRWHFLDRDIYGLDETTAAAYANYLSTPVPPPSAPSPVYSPALRRAEWAYRSSAVRIVDLVDGSSKVRTASDRSPLPSPPQPPPSPTKPIYPVAPVGLLPPTLTSPSYPATVEPFPARDSPAFAPPVAQSVGFAGFLCFVYTAIFGWLKVSRQACQNCPPHQARHRIDIVIGHHLGRGLS